jgi:hemerythrin
MIAWDDHYLIGVQRIDFEHHIFLDLINNFNEARLQDENIETLSNILEEIALYAKFHFRSEENMMRRIKYPKLTDHQKLHHELLDQLGAKMFGIQTQLYTPAQVESFLTSWFVNHVTHEDTKIAAFIKTLG